MPALTGNEIADLKIKFLSKLWQRTKDNLEISVDASIIWDEMQMGAYNKDKVMPFIVHELIEEGSLRKGNTAGEVILVRQIATSKTISLLNIFNSIMNQVLPSESSGIGVTLNVHGITISGLLIGRRQYYDELRKVLSKWDEPTSELFFENATKHLPRNEEEQDLIDEVVGIKVICLKNAKYYTGSQPFPSGGPSFWMGKMEEVDGFMLGVLEQPTTEQ